MEQPSTPTNETNKYLYIGGIIFLVFLVAWGMRKMGPNSEPKDANDGDTDKKVPAE